MDSTIRFPVADLVENNLSLNCFGKSLSHIGRMVTLTANLKCAVGNPVKVSF